MFPFLSILNKKDMKAEGRLLVGQGQPERGGSKTKEDYDQHEHA
jgi:hypothetical protein